VPVILALTILFVCHFKQIDPGEKVVKESDRLYQVYLEGNLDQARQSLEATVQKIEKAKLKPWGEANSLFFTYSRLYVLEKRAGNEDSAGACLVKARYWYLREHELNGNSVKDANKAVRAFTPERCMEFVDKWDRDHTGGRGPKYLQDIRHR